VDHLKLALRHRHARVPRAYTVHNRVTQESCQPGALRQLLFTYAHDGEELGEAADVADHADMLGHGGGSVSGRRPVGFE
jgi:hypothetical protein